jgi:dimethylargininase
LVQTIKQEIQLHMKFTQAIVREPGPSLVNGITTANLGVPDLQLALVQHKAYVNALTTCGLSVASLPPDDDYPDSTFVEDTALLTPTCAIIMRPGAPSRRGETSGMEETLKRFFGTIESVRAPGTADAGDILMVGSHYYIGLSQRTNLHGAMQIIKILDSHGLAGSTVPLEKVLHLKSGVAYLENNIIVVAGEFKARPEFASFEQIPVDDGELYAANCLWLNGIVLIAAGYPKTEQAIKAAGFKTIVLDMSEFCKLDGGLSCLSLRF